MSGRAHHFYTKKARFTKNEEKRLINRLCSVFAVLMPLTTLPQITLLYSSKNAGGLSLLMWVLYTIGCVPFLLFGIIYKHRQLIVLNALWMIVQLVMIVGILLYR